LAQVFTVGSSLRVCVPSCRAALGTVLAMEDSEAAGLSGHSAPSPRFEAADMSPEAPGAIESMMHAYGYTIEAVDKEMQQQKSILEGLENNSTEWGGFRLFFPEGKCIFLLPSILWHPHHAQCRHHGL